MPNLGARAAGPRSGIAGVTPRSQRPAAVLPGPSAAARALA